MIQNPTLHHHAASQSAGDEGRRAARGISRQALDDLIRGHLDLVYSAALRQVRDPHLAEDITQAVFLILAQKAHTIRDGVAVAGWLLTVTRTTAVDAMRKSTLIRRHEKASAKSEQIPPEVHSPDPWHQIAPILDAALTQLPSKDRDAITLRILQNQSLAQVGTHLGISQDNAAKRVSRALARLKTLLQKHGITTGAAALTATLASNAIRAAPTHLLAATLNGTTSASILALAKGTIKAMAWAKTKMMTAVVAVLVIALSAATLVYAADHPSTVVRSPAPVVASLGTPGLTLGQPVTSAPLKPLNGPSATPAREPWITQDVADTSGQVRDMAVDAAGNVYAVGDSSSGSTVRVKPATRNAWLVLYETHEYLLHAIALDRAGHLYVAGSIIRAGNGPAQGVLLRGTIAGGSSFDVVDKGDNLYTSLTLDAEGNVYAAANVMIQNAETGIGTGNSEILQTLYTTHGTVRKGVLHADGSLTFSVLVPPSATDYYNDIAVFGSGSNATIYVVGFERHVAGIEGRTTESTRWLTLKSDTQGTAWSRITFANDSSSNGSRAAAVATDPFGNVYVTGMAQKDFQTGTKKINGVLQPVYEIRTFLTTQMLRNTHDATWTTLDEFLYSPLSQTGVGYSIGVDAAAGRIYVAGQAHGPNDGSSHAVVRTNATADGSWQSIDDHEGRYYAFVIDAIHGYMYAGGLTPTTNYLALEEGPSSWAIRSTPLWQPTNQARVKQPPPPP